MRSPGCSTLVQQHHLDEADFDLDLLQRRVASARALLVASRRDADDVLGRLAGVDLHAAAGASVRQRALELSAACRAACIHLDTAGSRPLDDMSVSAAAVSTATAAAAHPADSGDAQGVSLAVPLALRSSSASDPAPQPPDAHVTASSARHTPTAAPSPAPEASSGTSLLAADNISSFARIDLGRLKLGRPLVAFDLETTGLDTKNDRIVEFAAVRVAPDGSTSTLRHLLDPGTPMPLAAAATHRITDATVKGKPRFAAVAPEIWRCFEGADILGYNALRFDVPLLAAEFARLPTGSTGNVPAGSKAGAKMEFPPTGARVVDAMVVWKRSHNFKLASAHRHFCGADMRNAHTALADATATLQVLLGQLQYYPGLANMVPALHELCCAPPKVKYLDPERRFQWLDGQAAFAFGKHKGFALAQVAAADTQYMDWLAKRDFGEKATRIIAEARQGMFPQPPEGVA